MGETVLKILKGTGLVSLVALCVFSFDYRLKLDDDRREKSDLYNKVRTEANTNNDKITDALEWAEVYESLDLTYDIHYSDPKEDLTIDQMKQYLEIK